MIKIFTSTLLTLICCSGGDASEKRLHLALVTNNLDQSLNFYEEAFQRKVVKLDEENGFVDFYGTVLAFHENRDFSIPLSSTVTWEEIPEIEQTYFVSSSHFGIFDFSRLELEAVIDKLQSMGTEFVIQSTFVNKGLPSEQLFAFVLDPQGYVLELRTTKNKFQLDQIQDYAQQGEENQKEKAP